ncbi:hypothetical protein HYX08_06435 [Candidatus Woesearchaeota archaeon]|nr:hypothetical protein [Candidatus Woesearchaeota archaeon]
MRKKDLFFYIVILFLVVMFLWQWLSKGNLVRQLDEMHKDVMDLHLLSGIGPLRSAHDHADVKVYINGQAMDFSQRKYQLTARFIHFEDGIGDVIHVHATGLTVGHLFKSLGMDFSNNCIAVEGQSNCNEEDKKLKFYVNGQKSNEFDSRVIKDLDKYLISYGNENDAEIQKQLDSITNLAPKYSLQK